MQNEERAGLLWVLAGFCTLSIGDAIVKGMAGQWPAPAMAWTRYIMGTLCLGALLAYRQGLPALALPKAKLHWLRGTAISISAIGMFLAVWVMPLSEATTIAFTQPIITAILAIIFLGERPKATTWIATAIAFVGVMIVLRPNFLSIGWGALLPLVGASGMAVTIIANRAVTGKATILAMQYYMSVTALIFLTFVVIAGHLSGVERLHMTMPHWSIIARCAFIGVSASFAQWFIFMGTVKAGAGTVAPMTYGQLLAAVAFGWIFFHEVPDALAMFGALIIIAAGLFLWWANRAPSKGKG